MILDLSEQHSLFTIHIHSLTFLALLPHTLSEAPSVVHDAHLLLGEEVHPLAFGSWSHSLSETNATGSAVDDAVAVARTDAFHAVGESLAIRDGRHELVGDDAQAIVEIIDLGRSHQTTCLNINKFLLLLLVFINWKRKKV